jgi:DNA-binding XRE family transcriptional regulator
LLVKSAGLAHDQSVGKPVGADVKRKSKRPAEIFGRAVTVLRIARKLSQASLAESLGYSTYYCGQMERGNANISCDVMAAVSSFFGMSIGQLWTYAEELSGPKRNR